MTSKGVDHSDPKVPHSHSGGVTSGGVGVHSQVKLAPGWMSLGRKSRTNSSVGGAAAPVSPKESSSGALAGGGSGVASSSSSSAPPRVRISKAELLERYEPDAPPGLPAIMSPFSDITSVDALVPVNIAPDEDLTALINAQSTSMRNIPRSSPSRSTSSISRHRLPPASPPAANGRARIGTDVSDRNTTAAELSSLSHNSLKSGPGGASNSAFSTDGIGNLSSLTAPLSSSSNAFGGGGGGGNSDSISRSYGSNLASGTGGTKRSASLASNRDFWSNSSSAAGGERKPLALKPRSAHLSLGDAAGGGTNGNGLSGDQPRSSQHGSNSYWTRSTSRGGADATANWRSGAGVNGINSNGGNLDSNHPPQTSSSANLSSGVKNVSGSSHLSGTSYSSRSGFGRETRDAFSRNKEALKPTNTRDLSALAKGSSRTSEGAGGSGNGSTQYNNREREYRAAPASSTAEPKSSSKPVDILTDSRNLWYYKDPRGEVQGPFSAPKLMGWLKEGYFDDTLALSRNPDSGFRPLAVVFNLGEKESIDVAPPGFVAESSTALELSDASSAEQKKNSDASARSERKMTVKEQQEEVEKQRLENRRKNVDKFRTTVDQGSNIGNGHTRVGVFGDELTDEGHVLEESASELPTSKSSSAMFELAPIGRNVPEKDHSGSSLSESRFASLMTSSGTTKDSIDESNRPIPSEPRLSAFQSMLTEPAKSQSTNDLLSHTSLPSGPPKSLPTSSQPLPHPEPIPSSNAQSGWQSNAVDPHIRAQVPAPAVSVGVSEHDLMALDPAIARATFSRRPAEASSNVMPDPASGHGNWNETVTSPKSSATSGMHSTLAASVQPADRQTLGRVPPVSAMPGLGAHNSSTSISMMEAQAQALARAQASHVQQALSQAQVQAHHAHAQAQAQARARAQAEAQARAQAQAAHAAHAQAQARARAAQVAHVQAQNATNQSAAQGADPFWVYKHQLTQLQNGWELHSRSRMEATQSLEVGRRHLANAAPGSLEHRQAVAYCNSCDAVIQEHTLNMERIKAAAQNTQAQMQRHHQQQQQLLAQRQAQTQIAVQPPVVSNSQDAPQRLPDLRSQAPIQHAVNDSERVPVDHEVNQLGASVAAMNMRLEADPSSPVQETDFAAATSPAPSSSAADKRSVIEGSEADMSPVPAAATTDSFPSPKPVSPHGNEESGWERVERKPKVDVTSSRVPQVGQGGSREVPLSSISLPSVTEPPRGPIDSHVLVVSADKDPRKLEVAATNERELDEAEAMRNKKAASIPAPWAKARQTGPKKLNLREIQRKEELESKAELEKQAMLQAQREQAARLAAASRQSAAAAPWGSSTSQQRTLGLREQMRLEEEQKLRAARQTAAANNAASAQRASRAASAQAQPRPAWVTLVASNNVSTGPGRQASTVVGKRMDDDGTFWETVGHGSSRRGASGAGNATRAAVPRATNAPQGRGASAAPRATRAVQAASVQPVQLGMKKQEASSEPTNVQGRVSSEMAKWCSLQLRDITGNESNDKTFAEYLASLSSETEIRDTLLQNLGSSDKTRAFADEFIRRLAFEKSSEPVDQGGSSSASGVGGGRKRGRRQRGAKVVDPSLVLGFTSTSSSQRIMQGQIEKPMD